MDKTTEIDINDYSFHDSEILEVRETNYQILEFLIDFPTDWEKNVFERHVISFHDVINYSIKEIPFEVTITILDINDLGSVTRTWGQGKNAMKATRNSIEIVTNAGSRKIEYSTCHFKKA
ncbi:hypothetical protein IDJ77_23080 [Mucilaginibacter sp. ZT4R22]|uniref:Immunity protein 50 of polymorphic toxin system n=1 Tax=Mucilaginibacter pankratovii TaxID=2772110 RepID=A0ABR7WWQ9_9SPHI|nr:hypothetical protein [Mucilaginibacter pankratovii]MBD1366714.1 hypothetical protein [Mucilaginibacter pankratovii]